MSNDCSLEMMLPDAITAQMTTYRRTGRSVAAKAISEWNRLKRGRARPATKRPPGQEVTVPICPPRT